MEKSRGLRGIFGHMTEAFQLSDRGILGRCLLIKLSFRINPLEMKTDIVGIRIEQKRHLPPTMYCTLRSINARFEISGF